MADLHQLPAWPQSQESLATQIAALIQVAKRLGLFDAADAVKQMASKLDQVKYGCHVDLEEGQEPDGCVIDANKIHDCIYAKPGMRKEQREYWRIVALPAGEVAGGGGGVMGERYIPVRQQLWQEPVFSQDEGEHLAPTRHQVDVWKAEASNFPATLDELPYGRRDWVDVVATRAFQAGRASATALLEQRHLAPALMAERPWEREGWCDDQGRCWFCNSYSMGQWSYSLPPSPGQGWGRLGTMTHSLPHWAIPRPRPLPQQETTNG